MNEEQYEKLKNDFLPKAILEQFNSTRKGIEKNKDIFENSESKIEQNSSESALVFKGVLHVAKIMNDSFYSINDHMELAYVSIKVLQNRVKHLENTLTQQGINIDKIYEHEDLFSFIEDHFKKQKENDNGE